MCLYGQTEEQEDVRQHQVEKEDIVGVGFPEFQLEYEEVEDRCIQRQSQDENHNHDSCIEFIQSLVCGFAVLDQLVSRISHLNGVFSLKLKRKSLNTLSLTLQTKEIPPNRFLQCLQL